MPIMDLASIHVREHWLTGHNQAVRTSIENRPVARAAGQNFLSWKFPFFSPLAPPRGVLALPPSERIPYHTDTDPPRHRANERVARGMRARINHDKSPYRGYQKGD